MARTLLRVMRGEFAFYLTEGSKGGKKGGALGLIPDQWIRKVKDGFVFVNSGDRARLQAMTNDGEQMDACQALFDSKKRRAYVRRCEIRGPSGRWEGLAFKPRPQECAT